jgi:hypothetical protein
MGRCQTGYTLNNRQPSKGGKSSILNFVLTAVMLSFCCRCFCLFAVVPGVVSWSAAAPRLHNSQTASLRLCQSLAAQQSLWQQGNHWTRRRASHTRASSSSSCRATAGGTESEKPPPKSSYTRIDEADIDDESNSVLPRYLEDLDDDIWDEYNEGEEPEGDSEYMDIPNGSLLGDLAFNPRASALQCLADY